MKNYAQILISCVFTWIKIGLVGILISFLCIGVSLWQILKYYLSELSFIDNVSDKPIPFALLVVSIIAIFFYFTFANKVTIAKLINQVWNNKLSGFVLPKVQIYVEKLISRIDKSAQSSGQLASIKESDIAKQLTTFVKEDKTINKVQRAVLTYGLKDINMGADDVSQDNLPQIITLKMENKIQSLTRPSLLLFRIFLFGQLLLFVLMLLN